VLTRVPSKTSVIPITFPSRGAWLLKLMARNGRFVFGMYRRHMRVIGYLGKLDGIFGVPATTRNWNTIAAIARVLDNRRSYNS
jgi:hypothetical protein